MPFGDGTGPLGLGPGTGRGKGWCRFGMVSGSAWRMPFRGRKKWIAGIAAPLIAAVIRDLANPSGFLRRTAVAFFSKRKAEDARRLSRDADYSVLDKQPHTPDRKKEE